MKPHTVILGAGATIAAIPNGDRNGRSSSVMDGLIEKLHLEDVLAGIELKTKSKNLEAIYSELHSRFDCKEVCRELEKRLYDYFEALELPDEPTVYDFLVLSLTKKDTIATFNWDPLLIQARQRCARYTDNLPNIYCLHGNVGVGYCQEHRIYGPKGILCPKCKKQFEPTKLLYPVVDKDYNNDSYIRDSWTDVERKIEDSFMFTIFGYSAPTSDMKAIDLLKNAWGGKNNRRLEEVSVIDIISEDDMRKKWDDFIYSHHYYYSHSFFDSYLGVFPRRSCECAFGMFMDCIFMDDTRGFKAGMTWFDIEELLFELLTEEARTPKGEEYPSHFAKGNASDYVH